MKMKNNLDERQEQLLLKIEHNGYWIAFWGLLIVLAVETFILNLELKAVAGEWLIFMVICIYMCAACTKNGIWDRRLKPNFKTNLIVSVITGVIFGALMGINIGMRYPERPAGSIAAGVLAAGFVFAVCLVMLSLTAKKVKKINAELETDEENIDTEKE